MTRDQSTTGSKSQEGVIVPASRFPHGYASIRSLARHGIETIAAVDDPTLPVTTSRYCDQVAHVPPSYELIAYRDALRQLAARPDVRTIIPHRPQDPFILAKYREQFTDHVDLVVPSLSKLRRVHDRTQLFAQARAAEVPIPETRLLGAVQDQQRDLVVKSRYNLLTSDYLEGFEPDGSRIVKAMEFVPSDTELDPGAIRAAMGHEPIVQEFIAGEEYLFGALYDEGEAVATFQHRQLRGDSWTGGGGAYRESIHNERLEAVGRAMLDQLEWHGLACLEFVKDETTGEFKLLEINPRGWQSFATAIEAGADFPYWYWQVATGQRDSVTPGYRSGVRTHYFYGELEHLTSLREKASPFHQRPSLAKRVVTVATSCIGDPSFDMLRLEDPGPAIQLVRTEAAKVGRRYLGIGRATRGDDSTVVQPSVSIPNE